MERFLEETRATSGRPKLVGSAGEEVELPNALYTASVRVIEALAAGYGVPILPTQPMLTTQQAADLLGISRPSLARLLDEGAIPDERIRSRRRIRLVDPMEFRRRRDGEREAALERVARKAQLSGIYNEYEPVRTR